MPEWFPPDFGLTGTGYVLSLRAQIALEIVKHCALVAGYPDGNDKAGRSKIELMPSPAVASRANGIASAIVDEWEQLGWIRVNELSREDEAREMGRLESVKRAIEWQRTDDQIQARLAARQELKLELEKAKEETARGEK